MKSIKFLVIITLVLAAFLYSCYYDKAELLYPVSTSCDTTNVTYSLKIAPIFTANCISCHSTANAASIGGGIKLQEYGDVKTNINQAYDAIINGRMPKNSGKLDNCSIALIRIWKNAGALQN